MIETDGKVSILLVDDRPDKLLAIEAVLDDLAEEIVRANSGREALRQVLARDFAVILLDVNMPGMDGFETAEFIRKRKNSEHIPIIFITAFGDEFHMARGYELGAVDYIAAPVVPEVLRSKVAVFVDLYRKTEQVKRQAESLRRRASQLQVLASTSLAINAARSVSRMLQTVTETAAELIGAHQAITLFVDPRSGRSREPTQALGVFSDKYAEWRSQPLKLDLLTNTLVYRGMAATRMTQAEYMAHPDWQVVSQVAVPPVVNGMLACPLMGRDGTRIGIVYLTDPYGQAFTAEDEMLLVQLAQVAAVAVENALFAEEREANRLKDEFLSTLSHELRTPLSAILGWTQLLRLQCTEEGEMAHALEVIERNARAQTKLIEDMLDVSRITTGKLRINLKRATLAPIITAAADVVVPAADAKNIGLHLDIPSQSIWLKADADRLQQVAWNLLTNAVKFTPAGGRVDVTVRLEGGEAVVRVSDTGRGIAPSFLPHVFDAFRQADSSSTRSHGGLGIGLTIVRHIVEMHGGRVAAESEVGAGSTFTVTLPIESATIAGDGETVNLAAGGSAGRLELMDLAGLRVLVVDDEPDARGVVRQILLRAGASVEVCASAAEGLEALTRYRPDILVSDIAMPDVDGYAFLASVRQLAVDAGGQTPAIALTAYARPEDKTRALNAQFQAHLSKPVDPYELARAIRGLCPAPAAAPVAT